MTSLWNSSIRGDSGFVVDSSQSMLLSSSFPKTDFNDYRYRKERVHVFPRFEFRIGGIGGSCIRLIRFKIPLSLLSRPLKGSPVGVGDLI